MKKLLLCLVALPIVFATACSKEDGPDNETPRIRMAYHDEDPPGSGFHQSITDFTIAGVVVPMDYMNSKEITASENTPFSFKVKKSSILLGAEPDEFYPYTGTISRDLFTAPETDYNQIDIKINNLIPTVTIRGVNVPVTATGGGSTGGGNPYKGIWVRQQGASGDETDLAIGTVPGEAANAVWMCEYKGNVGLYKGTISGSTITFDSQYGLPTYTVSKDGSELVLQANVSYSLPTNYKSGSWTSHCGQLGN